MKENKLLAVATTYNAAQFETSQLKLKPSNSEFEKGQIHAYSLIMNLLKEALYPPFHKVSRNESNKYQRYRLAVFRNGDYSNSISEGTGLTMIEAIVDAVTPYYEQEEVQSLIQSYGPDDYSGLFDYYFDRGIIISEPEFVKFEKHMEERSDSFEK